MMTGAPQHIEIFVTHVAGDGPLLKIWGQLDRQVATFVERLILQYADQFERGVGAAYPPSLTVNQLCCAKYGEDGVYYRAKIADISTVQQGYVRVNFIDYGNSDNVEITNIRSLQSIAASPLCSVDNQATEFTLSGIVPPMGVSWDQIAVEFIREKLCYAEFRCAIVAQISGRRLITLYYHETDFSEILIQKNLAIRITLQAQQSMFHNLQCYSGTPSYNFSVPPPPVPVNYSSSANLLVKTHSMAKQETGVISAPILSVDSKHIIYISNVEDGPYLFAVQLQTNENILKNMTRMFSSLMPLKPFSQSPIPGSVCVSFVSKMKIFCRAVVTNITEKDCVVYCVDFGNTETVPFSQIFELPSQFLQTKSLAMRFCLAGIQNTSFDEKAKQLFQELVQGQTLTLEVVEPEGPPLKQFGNILLNGENILNILKTKLKDLEKSKIYPQLPGLQPGRVVNVIVSYVESVDNFYVQYEANSKALSKIMDTMSQYCSSSAAVIRPNELYSGMPVCSLFSVDQQWYRARVLSVSGDQISVFYVDYGNTDTVSLMSLRKMDPNLSQAQVQAVACCLSGFEATGVPLDDFSNKLEELTLEKKLTMKIINHSSDGKFVVELHDTTVIPIVNINLQIFDSTKATYEETPIDEWRDPASGEPAPKVKMSSHFGKEKRYARKDSKQKKNLPPRTPKFGRQEDGDAESWRSETKKGGGWSESRDSSKKWGNRDDKSRNEKKWNRDEQGEEQKRWGKEDREGTGSFDNREERVGNKRWEGGDFKSNNDKSWDRRGFNKDNDDWKERENKRGFNKDDENWKESNRKRTDDWKEKDNRRGFNKDGDDWREKDNRRGFNKDGDDWKEKDNRRGFNKDGDDWKSRDRRFNKDGEDRSRRKYDDQGKEEKKWWGHDDRCESEKKWGSGNDRRDNERRWGTKDDDEERKWGGRDKRTSNTGEFKKWDNGERGNKRNFGKEDSFKASSVDNWKSSNASVTQATGGDDDWDSGDTMGKTNDQTPVSKSYSDPSIIFGRKENTILVSADDPSNFVLQINNKTDELSKLMENIALVYESGGTAMLKENQNVLSPCITCYSEDNAWYRATIISMPSEGMTEVRFVDYGNHEAVPSGDVKEILPEFLSIPLFGISCSLFAVQVPVAEWSSDQVTEFLDLTDGKDLEAYFVKKTGTLFEVILFDVEQPDSSINEKFGACKEIVDEEMSKKLFKASHELGTSLNQPPTEVVYASLEDSFVASEIVCEMTDAVSVTWFISPDQFYCQRRSMKSEFASMVNDIQKVYKGRTPYTGDLAVGFPVIAQFPADKVLYRAEVKEIKGLKYQVQYIDYGNVELLASNNIWQIEKRFLELPKQAIECCLSGIKPKDSAWPKDSTEFDRLFGVENLECTFHDIKDGKNVVSLTVNGKGVAEELVACGLALQKVEESAISEERLALKLLKGQKIPAHVSFIESLSKFFVHLEPVVAKNIQNKVDKYVLENKTAAPIVLADMVEHQMCLATPDGSQWYRGKIIDTSGTVGVCVSFVDFGDSDDISVDKIRPIPEELMGFRHQATECFVTGSDISDLNKDIEETFKIEVEAQDVIINIEDTVNERLSVHLFDIDGQTLELLKNVDKSSPLDIEPLCQMPILNYTMRMWVSHVEKLDEIWFQKENESEILSGLLELLFNFYEEEAKGVELKKTEGQLCAAKSTQDGSWYRAKVKDVKDEEISVTYIDYGNSETLLKSDVKELDPSFYRIHALAACASLAATVLDHETALAEFAKCTSDTVFDVSFVKDEKFRWFVQMENDDTNVIQHLINSNLVSEVEPLFKSEQVSLPLNEKMDVNISHFESCSEFWVQMDFNFLDILELQKTLQTVGSSQAGLTEIEVGTLCIAQFSDEVWYRAKILEVNGTSTKVFFMDYGNTLETDASSLKKLPAKFFHWPYFAVRCSLADTSFLESVELTEVCSKILSDTDTVFQLNVVEDGDPVLVSLFVGENELQTAVIERKETKSTDNSDLGKVDPDISEVKMETVFVSHISSPEQFWIQKDSMSLELQDLADTLVQAVDFEPVSDVQVGSIYAALFEDDEQWYRAKILELCEDGYNVLFVDYGNSSVVSNIRILPEEILNKPVVAKCCHLCMPSRIDCWSSEADKKFVELVGEGSESFQMIMMSSVEPYEVKLLYNSIDVSDLLSELCVASTKAPNDGELIATITHINNASEFWVRWDTDTSKLELITDNLVEGENLDPLQEYSVGLLCVSQFPDDEQWYRSRIISCQEQNIEVLFIDFGNTAFVSEVRDIPQDLTDIPPLAKRCALPLPNGVEKWPEKAEEEFISIYGDGSNSFRITIIQEGDPAIINLELNGLKVVDMLEKCCTESLTDKLDSSYELTTGTSSTEIEILSETEVIEQNGSLNVEEQTPSHGESILKFAAENSHMVTCDLAKDILNEVVENSIPTDTEYMSNNATKTLVVVDSKIQCAEEKEEQEKEIVEENECNSTVVIPEARVSNELIGVENSIKDNAEKSSQEQKDDVLVINDKANENHGIYAQIVEESVETSTSEDSIIQENICDQKVESDISPKKSEIIPTGKHGVEHCEQIIKDFSVNVQIPPAVGKIASSDGSREVPDSQWNSSPARKLPHAERIVPGSISRGHSTDLGSSPESEGKRSHKSLDDLTDTLEVKNRSVSDDQTQECNSDGVSTLSKTDVAISQESPDSIDKDYGILPNVQTLEVDVKNEQSINLISSSNVNSVKDEAVKVDNERSNTKSPDSNVFDDKELPLLPESPRKEDSHDTSESTINDNSTHTLDISEQDSTFHTIASSNSPPKDSKSPDLEFVMSGDVSGNLYEDSGSSTHSTVISNVMAASSRHVGIDADKIKFYDLAKIHTSEERFESSKNESISHVDDDIDTEDLKRT